MARPLADQTKWTMQRIAEALNVSQSTITEDLRNLLTVDKLKSAKTASNPKGAGRPKSSTDANVIAAATRASACWSNFRTSGVCP
jgi:predicted ArsR family transcriptional regulator